MEKGSQVIAAVTFEESDFASDGAVHVHAVPGDVGEVVDVFEDGVMVRWLKTGTACDAVAEELALETSKAVLSA